MKLKLIKKGMTSIFVENGRLEPCTLLQLPTTYVFEGKTDNKSLIFSSCKKRITKPIDGEMKKRNIQEKSGVFFEAQIDNKLENGEVSINVFKDMKYITVRGLTKGKGFAGVIKRHNFSGGRASHGCSLAHRTMGSTGQRQDPGKVMKGKKMPGHMGDAYRTTHNLKLLDIDYEQNCIVVRGAVPGNIGGIVDVTPGRRV